MGATIPSGTYSTRADLCRNMGPVTRASGRNHSSPLAHTVRIFSHVVRPSPKQASTSSLPESPAETRDAADGGAVHLQSAQDSVALCKRRVLPFLLGGGHLDAELVDVTHLI